mgnify:CR=1 FL=1
MSRTGDRLALPQVTLCAASSVNVAATLRALEASLAQVDFAACLFFTDALVVPTHPGITIVPVAPIRSAAAYSDFLLTRMIDHVATSHCLVAQWDGHVVDAGQWRADFLDHDYIGASWPQFADGHDVGNGGFSLRSARLMALCRDKGFAGFHPEDVAIGRDNRAWLEGQGMCFAPRALADRFSAERAGDVAASFGYHGVWHMPRAIGVAAFWEIYCTLDDRGTVHHDFGALWRALGEADHFGWRRLRMICDYIRDAVPGR